MKFFSFKWGIINFFASIMSAIFVSAIVFQFFASSGTITISEDTLESTFDIYFYSVLAAGIISVGLTTYIAGRFDGHLSENEMFIKYLCTFIVMILLNVYVFETIVFVFNMYTAIIYGAQALTIYLITRLT